jgi:8-oxo-dGTP pyrophosphatase MutT (NUDIX family)
VSIIPVIGDKLVILHEEQPSHPLRISFPGGHIEEDEEPLAAAIRELKEETGMIFNTFKLVGIEDHGNDRLDCWVFRFIATDYVSTVELHVDPGEKIAVDSVSFADAKELSLNNDYMSRDLMNKVTSLQELIALPPING